MEHAKYKKNITEKMKKYYIDDYGKKTDMPWFMLPGPFRDNILIVRDYEILYTKEIEEYKKFYEAKVRFAIENNKTLSYKDVIYWICVHRHRFYIYADDSVKDIYVLEKDLQLMEQ